MYFCKGTNVVKGEVKVFKEKSSFFKRTTKYLGLFAIIITIMMSYGLRGQQGVYAEEKEEHEIVSYKVVPLYMVDNQSLIPLFDPRSNIINHETSIVTLGVIVEFNAPVTEVFSNGELLTENYFAGGDNYFIHECALNIQNEVYEISFDNGVLYGNYKENVRLAYVPDIHTKSNVPKYGMSKPTTVAERVAYYEPNEYELLFMASSDSAYYSQSFDWYMLQNQLSLIELEEITINNLTIYNKAKGINPYKVPSAPEHGTEMYFDTISPSILNAELVNTPAMNRYTNGDTMQVGVNFDEAVKLSDESRAIEDVFQLRIEDVNGQPMVIEATTCAAITSAGTNQIIVDFEIDENINISYKGDIDVIVTDSGVEDLAGNILHNRSRDFLRSVKPNYSDIVKPVLNNVVITGLKPTVSVVDTHRETEFGLIIEDDLEILKLTYGADAYDVDQIKANWKVGLYVSESKNEQLEHEEYIPYYIDSVNTKSYDDFKLYISTANDQTTAFDHVIDKAQDWQVYYYVQDEDGNVTYGFIEDYHIDRKRFEVVMGPEEDSLSPMLNHHIPFIVERFDFGDLRFRLKTLGDYDSTTQWFYMYEEGIGDAESSVGDNGFVYDYSDWPSEGYVDTMDLLKVAQYNPIHTGTYVLEIEAQGWYNWMGEYYVNTNKVLFTIDMTAPEADIKQNMGPIRPESYTVTISETSGHEALIALGGLGRNMNDHKQDIKFCYSFVKVVAGVDNSGATTENQRMLAPGTYDVTIDYSNLEPGTYKLKTTITDYAGNETTKMSSDLFVVADMGGTINCLPNGFTQGSSIDVGYEVKSTDPDAEYRVAIDDEDFSHWNSTWSDLLHVNGLGQLSVSLSQSLDEGNHQLYFQYREDNNGNQVVSDILSDQFIIDRTAPEAKLTYSTEEKTYNPVTVRVTDLLDNISTLTDQNVRIDGVVNSEGTTQGTLYTAEESIVFIVTDEAGNSTSYKAQATWIKNDVKPAKVNYSTREATNQPVSISISVEGMDDSIVDAELNMDGLTSSDVQITSVDKVKTFVFYKEGIYHFTYEDDLGRIGYVDAYIGSIDTVAPTATITYSSEKLTNQNVKGIIEVSEDVSYKIYKEGTLVKEGSALKSEKIDYAFTGQYKVLVELTDEAGNPSDHEMEVTWIDKEPPTVKVIYSDNYYKDLTDEPITVTVTSDETIYIVNGDQSATKVFHDNANYTFYIQDEAGNMVQEEIIVSNFDNTVFELTEEFSASGLTNQEVTVTLTCTQPITIINNGGSNVLSFAENGKKYFLFEDVKGDRYYHFVTVDNIDKSKPILTINDRSLRPLYLPIGSPVDLTSGLKAIDNIDGEIDLIHVTHNIDVLTAGIYEATYEVTDQAGNTSLVVRTVEVIPLNEMRVLVDGIVVDNLETITGGRFTLEVVGSVGEYELQCKQGLGVASDFKRDKKHVKDGYYQVIESGYYTVFVQTQERMKQLIKLFVFK